MNTGKLYFTCSTAFLCVWMSTATALGQTSITLRRAVQLESVSAITVSDVARIKGEHSGWIGGVTVLEAPLIRPGTTIKVSVGDIRRVLSKEDGFNWGEVTIRGSSCDVVTSPPAEVETEARRESKRRSATHEVPLTLASSIKAGSIRSRVASALAVYLDMPPAELKVGFREDDHDLLDRSSSGLAVEVSPMSVSGRIPVRVTLFDEEGEKDTLSQVVRVEVRVQLETAKTLRAIRRGAIIAPDDVEIATNWVEPGADWARAATAVGSSVVRTIESGQLIRLGQVREPVAVKRNDIVFVRCVSGSMVLRSRARATTDAKRGEMIELESLGSTRNDRRRFTAKITGPGQAVVMAQTNELTGVK